MLKIIKQLDILSGKTLEYMLQFPFTTKPFYLMDKDGHELENAENKYQLATSLLKPLSKKIYLTAMMMKNVKPLLQMQLLLILWG